MLSTRPIPLTSDVNIHPQSTLNAKTPAGKALKSRNVLQENAIHTGPKTVFSKKSIIHTPFRPGTARGKKPLMSVSVARPLMDKTPFPNRVAAANFGNAGKTPGIKLSKLALLAPEPEQLSPDVAPLLRPSSARKSLRGRQSGNFKTPLTKGNYWDVSPGDMEGIDGVTEEVQEEVEAALVREENDEIEYMPPTAIECPYEPLFDLPDYKAMGRSLFELGHGGLVDDTADIYYAADIEQQIDFKQLITDTDFGPEISRPDDLELPELEDDTPFGHKPTKTAPPSHPTNSARPLTRAYSTRAVSQPARAQPPPPRPTTTIPTAHAKSKTSSRIARPTPSSSSTTPAATGAPVRAPTQTRTSALRAARNAAIATTPTTANPAGGRPASAGARAVSGPGVKKPAPATGTKLPVRTGTTGTRTGTAPTVVPSGARPRTMTGGRAHPGAGGAKGREEVDSLAALLEERGLGADVDVEDFRFDV